MALAVLDLFEEGRPVVVGEAQLDADAVEEGGEEFGALLVFGVVGGADVEGQDEASSGGGVAAAGIASLGEDLGVEGVEGGVGVVGAVGAGGGVGGECCGAGKMKISVATLAF